MNGKDAKTYMVELLTARLHPYVSISRYNLREVVSSAIESASCDKSALMQLKERMRNEIVHFRYKKENDEIRDAFGTLKQGIIDNYVSGCNGRAYNSDTIAYFDLEKNGWRCFRVANFIRVLN